MPALPTTLALVYDRQASPNGGPLQARIGRCRDYAADRAWVRAGLWIDRDDAALIGRPTARPAWQQMLDVAHAGAARGCAVVILIHDETRLAHDAVTAATFRHEAKLAGAQVVAVRGAQPRR
ncbi:recombinase family protein [Streptomyces sp. NPDC059506]|uniref:recombinase family protein n=1 Tax=Streptomyces TaxID=1883 RepID=UPI0015FD3515|nr:MULTISPECIES: recombinase family protein [unclassified Streptomyces]MCZ2525265.1 recombinase family protein [Streptomyces sp. HB2AG]QMV24461.1 hypothetical protein GQS52_24800 [Streptomyces sp. SCUT-3]